MLFFGRRLYAIDKTLYDDEVVNNYILNTLLLQVLCFAKKKLLRFYINEGVAFVRPLLRLPRLK